MRGGCGESIRIEAGYLWAPKGCFKKGGGWKVPRRNVDFSSRLLFFGRLLCRAALIAALSEVCREVRKAVLE